MDNPMQSLRQDWHEPRLHVPASLIKRIVAVHQTDASVRSSQLVKNIILIDIFSSFTSVSEIDAHLAFPIWIL